MVPAISRSCSYAVMVTVTSEANHQHLEEIRQANARLAFPRGLGDEEAERIVRGGKTVVAMAFVAAAAAGFRSSLWIAAMALAAHGIFDVVHDRFVSNPGVPPWWPDFCMAFDLAAAGYLAWLIRSGRVHVKP